MMTSSEKNEIERLRGMGLGYRKIAVELALSESAVKSYCHRHPPKANPSLCPVCGAGLKQTPHKRQKRFCSDRCRAAWWNNHRGAGQDRKTYTATCGYCGKAFESYVAGRKYCSRQCYADSRRKVVSNG